MDANEAIERAGLWLKYSYDEYADDISEVDDKALSVLSALAEENAALRAEVVRLQDRHTIDLMELEAARKAEAELTALRSEADAARPLIQQVEDTINAYGNDPVLGGAVASLDDALAAYREGKEPK